MRLLPVLKPISGSGILPRTHFSAGFLVWRFRNKWHKSGNDYVAQVRDGEKANGKRETYFEAKGLFFSRLSRFSRFDISRFTIIDTYL